MIFSGWSQGILSQLIIEFQVIIFSGNHYLLTVAGFWQPQIVYCYFLWLDNLPKHPQTLALLGNGGLEQIKQYSHKWWLKRLAIYHLNEKTNKNITLAWWISAKENQPWQKKQLKNIHQLFGFGFPKISPTIPQQTLPTFKRYDHVEFADELQAELRILEIHVLKWWTFKVGQPQSSRCIYDIYWLVVSTHLKDDSSPLPPSVICNLDVI